MSSSNFALVRVRSRCLGPVWSAVINGRLMLEVVTPDPIGGSVTGVGDALDTAIPF